LRREDTNDVIDPASKESVAEAVISWVQLTDSVDLSKLDPKNKHKDKTHIFTYSGLYIQDKLRGAKIDDRISQCKITNSIWL